MRSRRAGFMARRLLGIVVRDFFFAQPAAPRVVAGVNQDPVSPGDETRLATKAGDASLHFQEGFLHGIFGVYGVTKNIPCQVFHARAMHHIETLVGTQIAAPAGGGQCGVLAQGIYGGPAGAAGKVLGRFHSRPPFARQGRDSSLPRQRKSHSSHSWLPGFRRRGRAERQGEAAVVPEPLVPPFSSNSPLASACSAVVFQLFLDFPLFHDILALVDNSVWSAGACSRFSFPGPALRLFLAGNNQQSHPLESIVYKMQIL